ncbi:MAG: plasmid recombination protein [Saccharofermentans sp.]|nr:plasmid recombination protein [Saccharofermentans sp.]
MARTISFVKGKGSINHNNRDFIASNVDANRSAMNVTYIKKPIEQAYEEIFGDAVREYNAKQKRNDRKIDNYLSKIKTSKNNEKIFYENVVQIGKRDDTGILDEDGNITDEALLAKEILDEYARTFQERNPNLILFNSVLHMDEATPHLHMDYIPVAHGYKTGLSTRNSLAKGLQEMGIEPAKGKNDNETMHWQQRERDYLTDLCRKRGLEIGVLGIKREDYSIPEYKAAMREVEAAEAEIEILRTEKEEAESLLEASLDKIGSNIEEIDNQKETLEEIEQQIKEAESKRVRKMEDISKITSANKYAVMEAQEIEEKAIEVKTIFGSEPMVKIPRKLFDKLLDRYKKTGTFESLYEQYYGECYSQKIVIQELRTKVQNLTTKVKQLTSFIEEKGLIEAFKEFLQPKSVMAKLKENKAIVAERKSGDHIVKPDIKKKRSAVR